MSKQAVVLRRLETWDVVSDKAHEREPDPDKGVGDWEAFADISSEGWISGMIDEIPSGDEPVAKNPFSHSMFPYRFLASLVSAAATSTATRGASIEEEFARLANRWHDETDFLSSPSRITGNDTYLKIISMGERVIPLILEDVKERGGDWYRALRIVSGDDPVPVEARGYVEQMKQAWLEWGRERGYIK